MATMIQWRLARRDLPAVGRKTLIPGREESPSLAHPYDQDAQDPFPIPGRTAARRDGLRSLVSQDDLQILRQDVLAALPARALLHLADRCLVAGHQRRRRIIGVPDPLGQGLARDPLR